jgi:uncharacterized coiled-coil DUF342 family protein
MRYFNDKFKGKESSDKKLFDQVISAFKIGNTSIELGRTSHEKTYSDLICCTMLPKNTEVCFIDDMDFIQMKQDKVYYICPKSYVHSLNVTDIVERLIESNIFEQGQRKLIMSSTYWYNWFSLHKRPSYDKYDSNYEQDILISKKIMCSIREFFVLSTYYEHKCYNMHHSLPPPFQQKDIVVEEVISEEVKEVITEVKEVITEVKEDITEVKEVITEVKEDIPEVKEDILEVKEDIVEVKEDILEVKEDIVEVKEDIPEVKEVIPEVKEDIVEVKEDIVEVKEVITEVKEDIVEVKEDIVEIKEVIVEVKEDIPEVKEVITEVKEDIVEVKEDITEVKEVIPEVKEVIPEVKEVIPEVKEVIPEVKKKNKKKKNK